MSVLPMHDARSNEFYCRAVDAFAEASIEFLIGGAFALRSYTGIGRFTKDLDLMIRPRDVERAIEVQRKAGFHADVAFSHWLAKIHCGEYLIDLIYRAGNGLCEVDDTWFAHARETEIFGRKLLIAPPEEMIWQKAYIMERERYDGADVQHLFRSCAAEMNWQRLITRFDPDWRVLLSHLVLFGFVYPNERDLIPSEVMEDLFQRASAEGPQPRNGSSVCQGTLLSRAQYLVDVERMGYSDARIDDRSSMTLKQLIEWTNAIDREAK